jgi:TPR repeat protein
MLLEGQGVAHNSNPYVEAATLFHTAAEQGHVPQAEYYLALMYEYGQGGVEKNFDSALEYYKRASQQNHLESMYNLALMYAYGRGCVQNFDLARPLLEAAAERNHAQSIYYIGIFKTYGYGYKVNYEQAVNWFEKAAGLDDRAGKYYLLNNCDFKFMFVPFLCSERKGSKGCQRIKGKVDQGLQEKRRHFE